jgi:transposase
MIEMREVGCSVPKIALELGVSKSTAYLWTKHIPLDRTPAEREDRLRRHMERMREARLGATSEGPRRRSDGRR